MNVANLAQTARQSLARGLEALQARDAPPALIDVAQAVARAIGALVDLELSPDTPNPESVEVVLDALRDGLRLLQAPEYADHPAAARGMKAVAEAIGVVLTLARSTRQRAAPGPALRPAPAPLPPSPPVPPAVAMRPVLRSLAPASPAAEPAVITRAVNAVMGPAPASIRLEAPAARSEPAPVRPDPVPVKLEPAPAKLEPAPMEPEPAPMRPAPVPIRPEPAPALREVLPSSPAPVMVATPPSPRVIEVRTEATPPSPQRIDLRTATLSRPPVAIRRDVVVERDLRAVDAPLGAHSPSNFYAGLAGDVVASGGLFVATYQVPKVGEKVLLKISMPGGYEFIAKAKVAWTRDVATSMSPGSARGIAGAPGFGAQFCEITDEGRRLIQRYVRNREPLFHEDAT